MTDEPLTPLPEGRKPRRDDEFDCVVTKLRRRGGAEGQWGPYRVELRTGVPGDVLHCQVTKRRGDLVRARVLEVLKRSPRAVEPKCAHFENCGGCSFQDAEYELQLTESHARLLDLLAPAINVCGPSVDAEAHAKTAKRVVLEPVVAAGPIFGYRNKMDFTFGATRWVEWGEEDRARDFALGLHAPGRHDKVLDVQACEIAFPEANAVLNACRDLALEWQLAPWDLADHKGLLRHLVVRKGIRTDEVLVYLVTSSQAGIERIPEFAAELVRRAPAITTLVHGVRDNISSVAEGERDVVLHGAGVIHEVLGGVTYTLSARSFFQTNTIAAERLFEIVAAEACPTNHEVVYDLYCGAGSIALQLAPHCKSVWGFEIVESAVLDARANAKAAGIHNAYFIAGDARFTASAEHVAEIGAPKADVVVVDPPRAGLHPDVTAFLGQLAAPRLVYVSCNPRAAAVDIAMLQEFGYHLVRAVPIDLFPHTPHVECVFTLVYQGDGQGALDHAEAEQPLDADDIPDGMDGPIPTGVPNEVHEPSEPVEPAVPIEPGDPLLPAGPEDASQTDEER